MFRMNSKDLNLIKCVITGFGFLSTNKRPSPTIINGNLRTDQGQKGISKAELKEIMFLFCAFKELSIQNLFLRTILLTTYCVWEFFDVLSDTVCRKWPNLWSDNQVITLIHSTLWVKKFQLSFIPVIWCNHLYSPDLIPNKIFIVFKLQNSLGVGWWY
jgi:hypothetical protein